MNTFSMVNGRRLWIILGAALLLALLGVGVMQVSAQANVVAVARLHDSGGNQIGQVRLILKRTMTEVRVDVSNLPPGFHGFHVHAVGNCVAPDFTSAGGHYNVDGHNHPHHAADMPVLLVNGDGTAVAQFKTDRFTVAELFDADGSAIIVHASPDNYANIPTRYAPAPDQTTLNTGDAGGRLACGVIETN
jgi:Cu-Zn family superoxide dismutase